MGAGGEGGSTWEAEDITIQKNVNVLTTCIALSVLYS